MSFSKLIGCSQMSELAEVIELFIERLEIRGVPAEMGKRFPAGELPGQLIGAILFLLYPYIRNPDSESVMLQLHRCFWVNAGLRREGERVTVDGTIDDKYRDFTSVSFRFIVRDALPKEMPEWVFIRRDDGSAYLGSHDQILTIAAMTVNMECELRMADVKARLEHVMRRLEG